MSRTRIWLHTAPLLALLTITSTRQRLSQRVRDASSGDRGSLTTEQAIITGVLVAAAIALAALIKTVVDKYAANIN